MLPIYSYLYMNTWCMSYWQSSPLGIHFRPHCASPSSPPKFSTPSRKKVTPSFQILLSVFQLPSYCAIPHDPPLAPLPHKAFLPEKKERNTLVSDSPSILSQHSVDCPTQSISVFAIWYFVSPQTNAKDSAGKSAPPTLLPSSEIPPGPPWMIVAPSFRDFLPHLSVQSTTMSERRMFNPKCQTFTI